MTLGFTSTHHGMTQRQLETLRYLFRELQLIELHHGDCLGADAQAHRVAMEMNARIIVHPPQDDKLRAYCVPLRGEVLQAYPFLTRNRHIVNYGTDGLIAAPKDFVEPTNKRGQGTWTTIGYARKAGRRIWIVYPDGTFKEDTDRQEPRAVLVKEKT